MATTVDEDEYIPDWYRKSTLILGCGNILFGDDGFGPAVAAHLQENYTIPEDVYVLDVGIGAREILFTIVVGETRVKKLIIVDAVNFEHLGRSPGDIFELSIDDLPIVKIDDFSMHQIPSSNLLKELRDYRNIDVTILACQIKRIPEEVEQGLSKEVQDAVPRMCELLSSGGE